MDLIEELIIKKPHLADPLRFYQKSVRFMDAVKEIAGNVSQEQTAYPPEIVVRIVDIFSSMFELPEGTLSPLKQALELREIDFTRLPLREVPAFSLPYGEDDLTMILFLLSRPFFFALREACNLTNGSWEEGKCPVCNAQPALSSLTQDGRRQLYCSFCGTTGQAPRTQCPVCGTHESSKLSIVSFTGEDGVSIQTCDACKSYVKNVNQELFSRFNADLADLMSLPLDMVIQQKGYSRRSPNPIGMINMNVNG